MTTATDEAGFASFYYMVPYIFAIEAPDEILKRGLLEKIEVRQNDA